MNPGICSTSSCMRRDVFRYAAESAPSRRWVLKMTTTSVGFFTLRYGTYLCSRPIRGRYWARGGMGCPLWPTLPAVLRAVHEFQSGPRFIHSADLHVDEALGQGDGAHDILGQVGRDSGCPLRPRDPEAPIWRESVFPRQEPSGQVRASPNERVDHVDAAVQPFADCHALWKSAQQSNIVMRRMDHDHDEALFDPELLRQRFRRRTRGHRRGLAPSATEHVLARARQVSGIEYLFRFLGAQDALLDDELLDRLPGQARLLCDFCGFLVTDDWVQLRRDCGTRLRVALEDIYVRGDSIDALVREDARDVREELDVLLDSLRHDRHHRRQIEVRMGVCDRDRHVIADHRDADLHDGLGDHGVDFTRHDRGAGLDRGEVQLPQPRVGSGSEPAQLVRDLHHRIRDGADRAARFHERISGRLRLEMVLRDPELRVGCGTDLLDDATREVWVRVNSRADGGAANREFGERGPRSGHPPNPVIDLGLVPGELLAESDRSGVHQVGPSGLDDRIEFLCLFREAVLQVSQGRQQALVDFEQGGDVDRRRDDVVRGLARVHVVVRMDGAFLPEWMAQDLVRAVPDHLVRVHVRRGPAPGLEDVQWEVRVQRAIHHLLTRLDDRFADLVVEQSEFCVRLGTRHLDQAEGVDEPPAEADSADRKILDRSLSLDAPIRVFWDFDLPQKVSLDAELRHSNAPPCGQSPRGINIANESVCTHGSGPSETTRDSPGAGPRRGPVFEGAMGSGSVDGGASPDIRTSVVLRRPDYSLTGEASRSCYCER